MPHFGMTGRRLCAHPDEPAEPHDRVLFTVARDRRLRAQMRRTLRSAIPAGCVPPRDSSLTGHRDTPSPHCPRCGEPLRRSRLGAVRRCGA